MGQYTQLNKFAIRVFEHSGIPVPTEYEFKIDSGIPQFRSYPSVIPQRYVDWARNEMIRHSQETVLEALQGDEINPELLDKAGRILRAEAVLVRSRATIQQ